MSKVDEETIKEFLPYIKLLRQTAGWTQQELADRIGVKRQTVTAIENGKMIPSVTLFLAIVGLFTVGSTMIPLLSGVVGATGLSKVFTKLFKR